MWKMVSFLNSNFILSTFIQYFTMTSPYVVFLYSTFPMNQRLLHLEKVYLFQTCPKRLTPHKFPLPKWEYVNLHLQTQSPSVWFQFHHVLIKLASNSFPSIFALTSVVILSWYSHQRKLRKVIEFELEVAIRKYQSNDMIIVMGSSFMG